MKFSNLLLFYLIAVVTFSISCKKETVSVPPVSLNYFPTSTYTWTEYAVDSIYHADNDNNNDDSVYTYHFYIKEVIDSTYTDNQGTNVNIIKRFRRNDTLSQWNLSNVWTQRLTSISAYRIEDNVPLHKLSFPIVSSVTWNSNDANTLDEESNYYEYFHEPGIFNSMNFDSTLSVIQVDENNYITRKFGNEIYAAGVGLIYKQRDELGKRNGVVVSGMEYRMVVRKYGR